MAANTIENVSTVERYSHSFTIQDFPFLILLQLFNIEPAQKGRIAAFSPLPNIYSFFSTFATRKLTLNSDARINTT